MFGLGTTELVIIFVIIVIVFGVGKLPQIGEGLGKAIKGFKKATSEDEVIDVTPPKKEEEGLSEKEKEKRSKDTKV